MNLAVTDPLVVVGGAACTALACLFLVSALVLTLVLVRRSRSGRDGVA
jgi:hypothetical protein